MDQSISFTSDETFAVPQYNLNVDYLPRQGPLADKLEAEHNWLDAVIALIKKETLCEKEYLSW